MNTCPYCNKKKFEEEDFCSQECKDKFLKFEKKVDKHLKYFWIGIAFSILMPIIGSITKNIFLANMTLPILSITILLFPFSTPETIQAFGVKNSIIITRIVGILLIPLSYVIFNL